ncbi:MAG: nucleotidyltransferase family protein [Anaerolineales bacterium]|nr:nucleotidyltransferase family protein [Anaerolineales bacterium]
MRLARALRLAEGDCLAVTGPGRATLAVFRTADDVVEAGGRVLSATTVPLSANWIERAPRHLSAFAANRAAVSAALERNAHLFLTGPVDKTLGRAAGVSLGLLEDLTAVPELAALIFQTEAPPPDFATRALWVTSLTQPQLPPAGTLWSVFVDEVEAAEDLIPGRAWAAQALRHAQIEAVLLGQVRKPTAVREVQARVGAVVLAAGRSTRMGQVKQLLPWGHSTLLGQVISQLRQTAVSEIIIVTGHAHVEIEQAAHQAAAGDGRVRCVFNPAYAESEMARSLQIGLQALAPNTYAALVALADQPNLDPALAEAVIQRWRETQAEVTAPVHAGQRGHPLLFDRMLWPKILALPLNANPREAVQAATTFEKVETASAASWADIDTPEDYAALRH